MHLESLKSDGSEVKEGRLRRVAAGDSSEVDNRPESGAGNSSAEHPVAWRQIDFHPHFYFVAQQDTR